MGTTNRAEELANKHYDENQGYSDSVKISKNEHIQLFIQGYNSSQSEIDELTKEKSLFIEKYTKSCNEVQKLEKVNDELTKEVERLRKERESNLKEKMYFNRMKELVSKVAYDSEHYTKKSYEVLRRDAIGLLDEYNLTTH